MIIESTPSDNLVPHRDNIFEILNLNPIIQIIKWQNPIIAGGYATALFAAPREGHKPGYIHRRFYTDIDIYPTDENNRKELIENIQNTFNDEIIKTHQTKRALTFTIKIPQQSNPKKFSIHTIQVMLMKNLDNGIENVFDSYDFITAVVAIKPLTGEIYFHQDFAEYHTKNELQLYKPRYLDPKASEEEIIIQLLRIQKYIQRWDYQLSKDTLEKVMNVYNTKPEIYLDPNKTYRMDSGGTGGLLAKNQANIWKLMSKTITSSPYWDSGMDQHGLITGVKPKQEIVDMTSIFQTLKRVKV